MSNSDDGSDSKEIDDANDRKIHEKAAKVGYADGVAAGEENVFQSSFDQGYADGLRTGLELEKFRTFCSTISKNTTNELLEEAKAYESMNIPETTSSDHFQQNKHKEEPLNEISKHQNQYVNERLINFQLKMPQTSNLFSLKN